MLERVLHFKVRMLLSCSLLLCIGEYGCTPKVVYYDYDTKSPGMIDEKVVMHKIVNPELKHLIIEYNDKYKNDTIVRDLGLSISCKIFSDSIRYTIGYAHGFSSFPGVILCEPVDNKDVYLMIWDVLHDVSLPLNRGIELLKDANPKSYRSNKELQKDTKWSNGSFEEMTEITFSDFPCWEVVFDKDNHLLRVQK